MLLFLDFPPIRLIWYLVVFPLLLRRFSLTTLNSPIFVPLEELDKKTLYPHVFSSCAWNFLVFKSHEKWTKKSIWAFGSGPWFLHLVFANDIILFSKIEEKSIEAINRTLLTFMEEFGLILSSLEWFSPSTAYLIQWNIYATL